MVGSPAPHTGDLTYNPGMCPDWDSNRQPFGSQAGTQSIEPHQPGSDTCFFLFHLLVVFCSRITLTGNVIEFALNVSILIMKRWTFLWCYVLLRNLIYMCLLGSVPVLLTLFLVILQGFFLLRMRSFPFLFLSCYC